ncbi:MAG: hypothetical protein KA004_05125 [Verrucomicrobiales bacterium]|nr:hypothetical protein [Verrucomicrobiales bacterium]
MCISNYLRKKILDLSLGAQAFSFPGTVYLALYTVAPNASGGGSEVSGNAYARVAVTNNNTNWPDSVLGTGEKYLGVAQSFTTATGGGWGSIVAVGIFDAASNGNLLYYGSLTTPVSIGAGDIFRFPSGSAGLKITLE